MQEGTSSLMQMAKVRNGLLLFVCENSGVT